MAGSFFRHRLECMHPLANLLQLPRRAAKSPAAAELDSSATASLTAEQSISVKPQSAASAEGADTSPGEESGFHDVTPRVSEATVEVRG